MEDTIKEYSKDELTVLWQPKKCIHSAKCWHGLPKAFNPKDRPWIKLDDVNAEEIIEQVMKCPSGALRIKTTPTPEEEIRDVFMEDFHDDEIEMTEITVLKNGPLKIKGNLSVKHKDGKIENHQEVYLCRCGESANKPFCDGTHKKCGFKDE